MLRSALNGDFSATASAGGLGGGTGVAIEAVPGIMSMRGGAPDGVPFGLINADTAVGLLG